MLREKRDDILAGPENGKNTILHTELYIGRESH